MMYSPVLLIGRQRLARPSGGELAGRITLPVLALATDLADLDRAVSLGNTAKRRARLDGLKLLRVADQHHLRAAFLRFGQDTRQLARADHARFVDY